MANQYIVCGALVLGGLVFALTAKWDTLISHISMFVAGTMFFMFPGALLKREQLWYFRPQTEAIALSAIVVSLLCMAIGYTVGSRRRQSQGVLTTTNHGPASSRTQLTAPPRGHRLGIPNRVIAFLFLVCLLIKLFLDNDTVWAAHFLAIPVGLNANVGAKVLLELAFAPVAAACLTPWLWRNAIVKSKTTKLLMIGFVAMGVLSLSRTPAFYVLGTLMFYWLWEKRSTWNTPGGRLLLVSAVVVLLPLIIFLGAFVKGSNMLSERISGDDAAENSISNVLDFAVQEQYKIAISDAYGNLLFAIDHYPHTYEYLPSLSLTSILTAVVPRAWFPSKGYTPSYVLTSQILGAGTFESTGNSLATSFVGELWMNYGWAAVALGSFALGLLGAGFRRLASINWDGSYGHILFLMSLVAFVVTPRGDVFSTTLRGCLYIGMAWLIAKCVLLLSRRAQRHGRRIRIVIVPNPIKSPKPSSTPCAS